MPRIRLYLDTRLEAHRDDDQACHAYYQQMTREKRWAATMRQAIPLIAQLRAGQLDLLVELFPFVVDAILARYGGNHAPAPLTTVSAPVTAFEMPELEITASVTSHENPTYNMLLSGAGIGTVSLDDLPDAVIEYGIERGKLPASARQHLDTRPMPAISAGPKAMAVPTFAAPDIDVDALV